MTIVHARYEDNHESDADLRQTKHHLEQRKTDQEYFEQESLGQPNDVRAQKQAKDKAIGVELHNSRPQVINL